MPMSRRQFGAAVATGVGALAAPISAGQATVTAESARTLYATAIIIDALANPGSMNVSWPPRGPLSQKQRDAIASSGITAINVTVSADDFEAHGPQHRAVEGRGRSLSRAPVDRPPPRRHRAREEGRARSA